MYLLSILTRFSGKCYPDKSFSLGGIPREKKKQQDAQYERAYKAQNEPDYGNIADWLTSSLNIGGKFCSLRENPNLCGDRLIGADVPQANIDVLTEMEKVSNGDFSKFYDVEENLDLPLFIVSSKLKRLPRGVYGKHGITNYGKRVLKNSCILLQQRFTRKKLGFATCTLPDMGREMLQCITANWSQVVRRFLQKARRFHEKRNLPFIYVGCTEIQEKRFERTGLPVPHLHFVYVSKHSVSSGYTCDTRSYYTWWNEAVNEILCAHGFRAIMGVDGHVGSVKLEVIRTSASGYLGKYISKGVNVVKAMQEKGFEEFPKQWWFASMHCKAMFNASVKTISSDICAMLWDNAPNLIEHGIVKHLYYVFIKINNIEKCVGMTGTFTDNVYRQLFNSG